MSILIKNIEMPAEGWHKVIKIFSDGTVVSYYDSVELGKAVSVPPHGRLIDADALTKRENLHNQYLSGMWYVRLQDIEDAPTIIEAEGE